MSDIGLKGCFKRNKGCSLKYKTKSFFTDLKYAWQRAYHGYDSRDIWGFNDMFKERTIEILNRYRETRHCVWWCPEGYELGNYDENCDAYVLTDEQTDIIIETIIFHLQMSNEDFVEKKLYGTNIYDDNYNLKDRTMRDYIRISCIALQNQDAALKLITLFFNDLWD